MTDPSELQELLELGDISPEFVPSNNVSPGQLVPVVTDLVTRNVEMFKWGLIPAWAKDPKIGYKMFNARAETLTEKPSFRVPLARKRCLILADGFYEWKLEGDKKNPYLFTLKDRAPFTFAGLWDTWKDPEGRLVNSCTIITTRPNNLMVLYHDRMPVILGPSLRWQWLEDQSTAALLEMLNPISEDLMQLPQKIDHF
ncbi:MAG: SOS response-associated peptidase [Anaerolineaceae bacterium]|nr:SOS response-associated peptidase [Anaerolineaceae bacterium]